MIGEAQQSFADNLQQEHAINKELNEKLEQKWWSHQSLENSHHELQRLTTEVKEYAESVN